MIFSVLLDDPNLRRLGQKCPLLARMEMESFPPNGMALILRQRRYNISDVEARLIPDGEGEPHRVEFQVYVQEQLSKVDVAKSMRMVQSADVKLTVPFGPDEAPEEHEDQPPVDPCAGVMILGRSVAP